MIRTRITLAIIALVFAAGTASAAKAATKGYPFHLPPDKAVAAVEKLDGVSGTKVHLTDDERKLFEDARDGKLDKASFAEACLMASGVTDPAKRKEYAAKLDAIVADARQSVEGAKTAREKAERLLKFLHDGPMKGGYQSNQTDLHTILDDGTFNCVSSAALFNVVAQRLGLVVAAVEVPQHVFSLVIDGNQRIDVETTSPRGVDPKGVKTPKGQSPADRYKGKRREVGELGLAAVIAYNHGVGLIEDGRFHESILASLRALSLDPVNPGAAQNTLAGFVKWALELNEASKYEEALTLLATGLEVCPKDSAMRNNHKLLWNRYSQSLMADGKVNEALTVLRRAAKAIPSEDFETKQAFLFIAQAHELVESGKWDEALKLFNDGLGKVDQKAVAKLKEARIGLFLNRSVAAMEKSEFEAALKVLNEGAKLEPKDSRIKNNIKAVFDRWANGYMEKKDWTGAAEVYEKGLAQFPGDSHLKNNLDYCKQEQARK
jgi:tetratricopeptide (TPR) repeat protein